MMEKAQEYTIGSGLPPEWCRRWITPFQKKNGQIAYEYHGKHRDYDLNVGDKLILIDGKIHIRREAARWKQRHTLSK